MKQSALRLKARDKTTKKIIDLGENIELCTGHKDKNGKTIFEGDRVKFEGYKLVLIVRWQHNISSYVLITEKNKEMRATLLTTVASRSTIID